MSVINRGSREQVRDTEFICCDRMQAKDVLKGRYFDAILDVTAYTREHIQALPDSGVGFGDYIFISSSAVYPETATQMFREKLTSIDPAIRQTLVSYLPNKNTHNEGAVALRQPLFVFMTYLSAPFLRFFVAV